MHCYLNIILKLICGNLNLFVLKNNEDMAPKGSAPSPSNAAADSSGMCHFNFCETRFS